MKKANLAAKIENIERVFDIEEVLDKDTSVESIAKYYRVNRIPYSIFHNKHDFVHMGISRDGVYKEEDLFEQPNIVGEHIRNIGANRILELAAGKGANSLYLAGKFPSVQFVGLDLPESQLSVAKRSANKEDNFVVQSGDFHDLSSFEDGYFDLVFVIEALCHSNSKEIVIREVKRVLRADGLFIIADGYLGRNVESLNDQELLAKKLVEKGMLVGSFEEYDSVKDKMLGNGFTMVSEEEVSEFILPTLYRFERLADFMFKLRGISKVLMKLLPDEFTHNAISGYLMPDLVSSGIAAYYITIFKKH